MVVGRLAPGETERPAQGISLDTGRVRGGADGARAVLTPAEARQLAAALVQQAAAAEGGTTTAGQVEVSYLGGESYAIATRGHTLLTDQPAAAGGTDTAMTPTGQPGSPRSGWRSGSPVASRPAARPPFSRWHHTAPCTTHFARPPT